VIRWIFFLAGILGAIGVGIGAHAAHGLEEMLSKQGLAEADVLKRLDQCEVAVRYQLIHAVALLAIGASTSRRAAPAKSVAAVFMLCGIALFCGGLYSMAYLGQMGHWAIVPSGGLCFIIGWLGVANAAFSKDPT
jgi:uncharacterized membrane protein YgdD (TMEM256/DUF423 family)